MPSFPGSIHCKNKHAVLTHVHVSNEWPPKEHTIHMCCLGCMLKLRVCHYLVCQSYMLFGVNLVRMEKFFFIISKSFGSKEYGKSLNYIQREHKHCIKVGEINKQ